MSPALQQPWVSPIESSSQYALNIAPGRVKGRPTEFRLAIVLTMDAMGITISGKAVPTGAAFIMCYLFLGLIITEFAMRRQKSLSIPWGDVEVVRMDPVKRIGVVCYHLPGKPKSLFSLGFKTAEPAAFDHFGRTARLFVPDKVEEGPVKGANIALVILVAVVKGANIALVILVAVVIVVILVILASLPSMPH